MPLGLVALLGVGLLGVGAGAYAAYDYFLGSSAELDEMDEALECAQQANGNLQALEECGSRYESDSRAGQLIAILPSLSYSETAEGTQSE